MDQREPDVIFVSGPTGSGKTTVSKKLEDYHYLSCGDFLREIFNFNTQLSRDVTNCLGARFVSEMKAKVDRGELVDQDLWCLLAVPTTKALESIKTNGRLPKLVLDGYLRTAKQVEFWVNFFVAHGYGQSYRFLALRLHADLEVCKKRSKLEPSKVQRLYEQDRILWPEVESALTKVECPTVIVPNNNGDCYKHVVQMAFGYSNPISWAGPEWVDPKKTLTVV